MESNIDASVEKHHIYEKDYIRNPTTSSFDNVVMMENIEQVLLVIR